MFIILSITGLSGFLASVIATHLGLSAMVLRYPLSVAVAYGAFLLCLRLWIIYVKADDDFKDNINDTVEEVLEDESPDTQDMTDTTDTDSSASLLDGISFDLDEGIILVAVIIIILSLFCGSAYFIYIAPEFLDEILADTLLVAFLYRRTKTLQKNAWVETAVKKSWWMFLIIAVVLGFVGLVVQFYHPDIKTFGDMLNKI